jgi:putative component of toxin-antitoxin plasmid stabilization module
MFEKCIKCDRLGQNCVPNLMLLPFPDLIQWSVKRQKYLEWTNQMWADKSKVPVGTINRIKAGDYLDCKYSTIKNLLIALIGGTTEEFPCMEQMEKELKQLKLFEEQKEKLATTEKECKALKVRLNKIEEQHRKDIRAVKEEYQEQLTFLKDELKAWRTWHQKPDN